MPEVDSSAPSLQAPVLAAPGAGIPWRERMLYTYVVRPFVAARSDWVENARSFAALTEKIVREVEGLSEAQMTTQILVSPQAGLEDSSRFWSIAMALEHLVIVGTNIERIIAELSDGITPAIQVDIAKVKPLGGISGAEAIAKFKAWAVGCEKRVLEQTKQQSSKVQLKHPWFGGFHSLEWQWLLAQHHVIHLKQIRAIKRGL